MLIGKVAAIYNAMLFPSSITRRQEVFKKPNTNPPCITTFHSRCSRFFLVARSAPSIGNRFSDVNKSCELQENFIRFSLLANGRDEASREADLFFVRAESDKCGRYF